MKIRKPVVAGQFYPSDRAELNTLITEIFSKEKDNINYDLAHHKIIGGVVPHAGYIFSAYQAIHFFEIAKKCSTQFDTVIIINPSHTGTGNEIAIDDNDSWETPLGRTEIDKDFSREMAIPESDIEEEREHSGEVMLPLLQHFLNYEFKILPITIMHQTFENAKQVANEIKQANEKLNKKILIIASSDFSHFVHPNTGAKLDQKVIDEIFALNTQGIEEVVRKNKISVCGYGPIMALMEYSKLLNHEPGISILKKGNSGDIIPSNEVVDYVSMLFYQEIKEKG
ncbi:MAG: AmmeMemoRadiSam system protein B [Bacteroidales bacterium]